LSFSRAVLRETCRAAGLAWVEDPSNENEKFLRVRLRGFEDVLAAEGLSPERLSQTLRKLAEARAALEVMTARALEACAVVKDGRATLDIDKWREEPRDIRRRVVAALLQSVAPQDYPPRSESLDRLCDALEGGGFRGRTLAGCEIAPQGGKIVMCREAEGKASCASC
jgi:tRNA(Ile)-lysidine synthase